jgi:hypothetical protein
MLFALTLRFFMNGIFLSKHTLTDKSDPATPLRHVDEEKKPQKIIMLLVDALREDFVEMDMSIPHYLDTSKSVYKGRKI